MPGEVAVQSIDTSWVRRCPAFAPRHRCGYAVDLHQDLLDPTHSPTRTCGDAPHSSPKFTGFELVDGQEVLRQHPRRAQISRYATRGQGVVQDRGWVHSHTANQTGSITRPALSTRRSRSSAGAAFGPRSGRPGRYGARPDRPPAFALDQPVTTPRPAVDTGSANWRWGHKNLLAPLRDDPLKSAKRQHDVSRTRGRDLLQELPHFRTKDPYLRVSLRAAPYAATITMPSRRL